MVHEPYAALSCLRGWLGKHCWCCKNSRQAMWWVTSRCRTATSRGVTVETKVFGRLRGPSGSMQLQTDKQVGVVP